MIESEYAMIKLACYDLILVHSYEYHITHNLIAADSNEAASYFMASPFILKGLHASVPAY